MKPPEDELLLRNMLNRARLASTAARGRSRQDPDVDPVLATALERSIEFIGEAPGRVSEAARVASPAIP